MLIEKIPAQELNMIDGWRRDYAWSEDVRTCHDEYVSMETILHEWDTQKSKNLYRLLGDNLQVTKELQYNKSYEELQEDFSEMTSLGASYGRTGRSGYTFSHQWYHYMNEHYNSFSGQQYSGLIHLISDECLIDNIYNGDTFEIPTPDGKMFKVQHGCKTIRALSKLANIFNIEGFEDFRICHSQILNQKTLSGKLTLSIHPLDYMTMSDNNLGWESCMSWSQFGGYRQGTVEMMNSPYVIVAYLSAESPMHICGQEWNNKKWRQLFVVTPSVIAGVKDYPYHNEDLGREVMKWLIELAKTNLSWSFGEITTFCDCGHMMNVNGLEFSLDFSTNMMYNDFGCLDRHLVTFVTDLEEDDFSVYGAANRKYLHVKYSGSNQCMICGDLNPLFDDESCLACEECQDILRCDMCGDSTSETTRIDGYELCWDCYDNRVQHCEVCGDPHLDDNMTGIFIIPKMKADSQDSLREYWETNRHWHRANENDEFILINVDPSLYVCERCLKEWVKTNMREGCYPHEREVCWDHRICVYYDDLTDAAREEYAWGYDGDPEAFRAEFSICRTAPSKIFRPNIFEKD